MLFRSQDGVWHWATASEISGSSVRLSSPQVPHPLHVRYGWDDFPVLNLVNGAGLPASPFRTDSFKGLTRN